MTCRLFIDEVGNADLKGAADDPNIRYLSLTGVVMKTIAHNRTLAPSFAALKAVHWEDNGDNPVIFHRREIVRREGRFAILRDPAIGSAFDAKMLSVISQLPFLAITITIDKKAHLEQYVVWRYDPYHYCLQLLVERYVRWLDRNELYGDVVIEARFKKVDKKLKASFWRLWNEGTENMPKAMIQKRLVSKDIGMFAKSADIAGLQLADLIAHPSCRDMRAAREGFPRPADFGTAIADILVREKYARHPISKRIDGWGTKWLP